MHLFDDIAYVSGINFIDNYADGNGGEGGDGGAIFIREENVTIRNCNIVDNYANVLGGGINNYNDFNTIDSCTIYRNYAHDTGGGGGGVYTEKYNDIALSGTTIIRGNSSESYDDDNMYLPGSDSSHCHFTASTSGTVSASGNSSSPLSSRTGASSRAVTRGTARA